MDGRPHPKPESTNPTWLGHSVGRWEGETLVVDVTGYNEGGWVDMAGDPPHRFSCTSSSASHERISTRCATKRPSTTPGAYTEPWTIGFDIVWDEKGEIQEYICQENSPWMRRIFAEMLNSRTLTR
jgi:hypothetical protein